MFYKDRGRFWKLFCLRDKSLTWVGLGVVENYDPFEPKMLHTHKFHFVFVFLTCRQSSHQFSTFHTVKGTIGGGGQHVLIFHIIQMLNASMLMLLFTLWFRMQPLGNFQPKIAEYKQLWRLRPRFNWVLKKQQLKTKHS